MTGSIHLQSWLWMAWVIFTLLLGPAQRGFAAILFTDNFDGHSNWSPPQPEGDTLMCVPGGNCSTPVPVGYNDYRIAAMESCSIRDGNHNTLNINGNYPRGGTGKSLQFWSEPCYSSSGSWGSDGLLGVTFAPQAEVYVRYWMKFPPNWIWDTTSGSSPMQKFLHISHNDPSLNAELWDFHDGTQNKPRFVPQFAKYGGGTYRIQFDLPFSPLTAARDNSASNNYDYYFGPSPFDWTSAGGPGDGQWHCYEYYVKLNSSGGTPNGFFRNWYDGHLIADETNIVWVPNGDNPANWKWNHVWLGGNNSNQYVLQSTNEQWYAVDDFVIYTPMSPSDPACNGQCTADGRLPLNYVIGGGQPSDTTAPGAPTRVRIR